MTDSYIDSASPYPPIVLLRRAIDCPMETFATEQLSGIGTSKAFDALVRS